MNGNYRDDYRSDDTHAVAAGLLGAVAGAAVGIALASILSDPQRRKVVGRHLQDMQKWGNKTLKDLQERSQTMQGEMEDTIGEAQKKAERIQQELESTSTKLK